MDDFADMGGVGCSIVILFGVGGPTERYAFLGYHWDTTIE
jgi:hypothetical protein